MSLIYLASRYSRRLELLGYKAQLEAASHEVTSRWLNGEHVALDQDLASLPNETLAKWAEYDLEEDLEDIGRADVFVMFTEETGDGGLRGGRHCEFAFALAQNVMWVAIVGPMENTFHCLSSVKVFPTFKECLDWIDDLEAGKYEGPS